MFFLLVLNDIFIYRYFSFDGYSSKFNYRMNLLNKMFCLYIKNKCKYNIIVNYILSSKYYFNYLPSNFNDYLMFSKYAVPVCVMMYIELKNFVEYGFLLNI